MIKCFSCERMVHDICHGWCRACFESSDGSSVTKVIEIKRNSDRGMERYNNQKVIRKTITSSPCRNPSCRRPPHMNTRIPIRARECISTQAKADLRYDKSQARLHRARERLREEAKSRLDLDLLSDLDPDDNYLDEPADEADELEDAYHRD